MRLAHTKCAANQLTGNQMAGYDADTSKLVAQGLGVEPCFVTPTWSEQISGHWGDRWDIAFASMGITRERMTRLYFTQPYSAEAERFFVRKSSSVKSVQQLSASGSVAALAVSRRTTSRGTSTCPESRSDSWSTVRRSSATTSSATASPT